MSFQKAYTTSRNNTYSDTSSTTRVTQSWAWLLTRLLLNQSGAGISAFDSSWTDGGSHTVPTCTCAGSSNGTTSNMSGTDLWTNTFSAANLPMANDGTDHAWFVVALPAGICSVAGGKGPAYFLIDLDEFGGAGADQCGLYLSFAGFTGGSITNRPTATDEVKITTNGSSQTIQNTSAFTTDARYMSLTFAQDGSFLWNVRVPSAGASENAGFVLETSPATGRTVTYIKPLVLANDTYNNSLAPFTFGNNHWQAGSSYYFGQISGWNSAGNVPLCFSPFEPVVNASSHIFASTSYLARVDMEDSKYDDLPIFMFGNASGNSAVTMVQLIDLALAPWNGSFPGTPPQNSNAPSTGQQTVVTMGNMYWPCSGILT